MSVKQSIRNKMKSNLTVLLALIFVPIILDGGCSNPIAPEVSDALLSIDLPAAYYKDSVRVELDNNILLQDTITTNLVLGLAWIHRDALKAGSHRIGVFVLNRGAQTETTLVVRDTTTVVVNFDRRNNKLWFRVFNFLFHYE